MNGKTKKNIKKILLMGIFSLTLISCATKPTFEGKGEIIGKVMETNGKGLANCSVTLDSLNKISTSNTGIFVFRNISPGKHKITVEKENYSIEKKDIDFFDRQTFVEIKCKNTKETLLEAEKFIDEKDLDNAKETLKKLNITSANMEINQFYKTMIDYLEKPTEKKLKNLYFLANMGGH